MLKSEFNDKEVNIMSNYEEFDDMITYGIRKYYTGKQIKNIIISYKFVYH